MSRKLGLLGLSLVALMAAVPLVALLLQEEFPVELSIRGWIGVAVMGLLGVFFFLAAMHRPRSTFVPAPTLTSKES